MRHSSMFLPCIFALCGHISLQAQHHSVEDHVSVSMSVEGNAPIITLAFKEPNGSMRSARFVLDSGGGAIIFDQGLAKDIGLKPEGAALSSEGQQFKRVKVPLAFVGGMPLDLRTSMAVVHLGGVS